MMHIPGFSRLPGSPSHFIEEFAMRTKLLAAALLIAVVAPAQAAEDGLTKGTPELKSATTLAFGPHGILFVGDSAAATVFAIDTGDAKPAGDKPVNVDKIDGKVAAALGVTEKEVTLNDIKVNPASGNVYIAVKRGTGAGQPAIFKLTHDGTAEPMNLKDVMFSKLAVPGQDKGKAQSFTAMAFLDGRLFVAGLSSEDFASTLWALPYPFKEAIQGTGIEIYHGAHGRPETKAPIRVFVPYKIGKEDNIMASYTCTPLVKIPVSDLKPGAKVKGTTIAELGNMNNPLDMISYTKDGKDYLLSANTRHGVIKIPTADFASASAINDPVRGGGTAGIKYDKITDLKNVTHLAKIDDNRLLVLIKTDSGFDLKTVPMP
jgi:hypothetical protein